MAENSSVLSELSAGRPGGGIGRQLPGLHFDYEAPEPLAHKVVGTHSGVDESGPDPELRLAHRLDLDDSKAQALQVRRGGSFGFRRPHESSAEPTTPDLRSERESEQHE